MMKNYIMLIFIIMISISNVIAQNSEKDFYITNIRADCLVENNTKFYSSIFLMDGTDNSWAAKPSSDGCGAEIYIDFNRVGKINYLYIKNGFGLSSYFTKNNRVKELIVYTVNYELFQHVEEFTLLLGDNQELKKIEFPKELTTNMLILKVKSIYKGNLYNDTCLNEISLMPIKLDKYNTKPIDIFSGGSETFTFDDIDITILDYGKIDESCYGELKRYDFHAELSDWGYTNNQGIYIRFIGKVFEPMTDNYEYAEREFINWNLGRGPVDD